MTRAGLTCRLAVVAALALGTAACASVGAAAHPGVVDAVAAENEYANVVSQVGGRYVRATAIESNPNTDPHTFEASPGVAREVADAQLVVQNGLGYDTFMNRIESAQPTSGRTVVDVQTLLHLPDSTPNPHLWYRPGTMSAVAGAVAADLADLLPAHSSYFRARLAAFDASLKPWLAALATLRADQGGAAVASTEPVGDYLLQAAGLDNRTPLSTQADIMNGVDLSPQQVTAQDSLLSSHRVRAFVYNQQVVDSVTESFLAEAHRSGVPVVGVYETMPTPGFDYQSWMLAETRALQRALANGTSTQRL